MNMLCEIRSFAERDVDVWLAEELRVNSVFAQWFVGQVDAPADVMFPATRSRVSVMGENGETDVEAIFSTASGKKFALLIEDKIEHSLSKDQIARYFKRGSYGITYGFWDCFAIAVFAPAAKLSKYAHVIGDADEISFEGAADYLVLTTNDERTRYRSNFLVNAASEQRLDPDGTDGFRILFWKHVYSMLDRRYPGYFAVDPSDFPKTTYIAANCVASPGYFRLDLKGHMGEVDLAFKNTNPGPLLSFLEAHKPDIAKVVFNKRSIALQIKDLPKFFVGDGIDIVEDRVLKSFDAAHSLLEFWRNNRDFFDAHYGYVAD